MNDCPESKDIIHVYVNHIAKDKFAICIDDKHYFIINTKAWKEGAQVLIEQKDYSFLSYDSHIDTSQLHNLQYSIENNEWTLVGQFTPALCLKIKFAAQASKTLTERQIELVSSVMDNLQHH